MKLLFWRVKEKCSNCKFSYDSTGGMYLECRRSNPVVDGQLLGRPKAAWPLVNMTHWCGEFKKKKNA